MSTGLHAVPPPAEEPPDPPTTPTTAVAPDQAAPDSLAPDSLAPEAVLGRWLDENRPARAAGRPPASVADQASVDPLSVARAAQQAPGSVDPAPRHAGGRRRLRILGRLRHRPEVDTTPDTTLGPTPVREAEAEPEPLPAWIPAFVEYRTSELTRLLLGALFTVTVVVAVVALFWAASVGSGVGLLATGVLGLAAAMLWWGLLGWAPTVVSLSRGQLEVARGERVRRFDLRSTDTRVDLGHDPRSLRWRAVVSRPGERDVVIRRQHVKTRQFCQIVSALRS